MKRWITLGLAVAVCLSFSAWAQDDTTARRVPSKYLHEVIDQMPKKAPATPKAKRRLLVFTMTKGFRHSSIEIGAYAMKVMGLTTGAFEVTHSEDPDMFAKGTLEQFDAVLMLNTTQTLFENEEYKQNLVDFVKSGKGLAGIHAATDTFYDWPEYGQMMGGYFNGHPWGAGDTVTVENIEPDHILNTPFGGEDYVVTDEIYQIKDPYSRDFLRVILRLNTEKTDMTKKGIQRTDGDFPIAWLQEYGEGRVFYCSLGHNEHIYYDPTILEHYLYGLQYALGDLEADAVPSAKLSASYLQKMQPKLNEQALLDLVDNAMTNEG